MRRQNVGSALIWIDAMSINQECADEKNHQVQVMGHIYQEAERVYAWLGEGSREIELVLWLGSRAPASNVSPGNWYSGSAKKFRAFAEQYDEYRTWSRRTQQSSLRQYWRRLWTLQEQALAQDLVYVLNTQCCGLDGMFFMSQCFEFPESSHFVRLVVGLSQNRYHRGAKFSSLSGNPETLAALFNRYWTWNSSLLFDKVYALLGLLTDEEAAKITVDYQCGKMELLARLLRPNLLSFTDIPKFVLALSLSSADLKSLTSDEEISVTLAYALSETRLRKTGSGRARTSGLKPKDYGEMISVETNILTTYSTDEQLSIHASIQAWCEINGCDIGNDTFLRSDSQGLYQPRLVFSTGRTDKQVVLGLALPEHRHEFLSQHNLKPLQTCLIKLSHCGGTLSGSDDPRGQLKCTWRASIPISVAVEFWVEYLAIHQALVDAVP